MALVVQKFGGSSVADVDGIKNAARIVSESLQQGNVVVAVVSAMHSETDRLIKLARTISNNNLCSNINLREYNALISTGEQMSAALLSMALEARDCPAHSYNAAQIHLQTTNEHSKARIVDINPQMLLTDLEKGYTPVVAGFQGITENGEITTLGRGGSDLTAVALAAVLQADECQIFTDIDGVYTSDPKDIPTARRISKITFDVIMEMSSLGAKILQNRCLEFAGKYKVPIRVLSSLRKGPGTIITYGQDNVEHPLVFGVTFERCQAKLTFQGIPKKPELASYILRSISKTDIEVDMIIQNVSALDTKIDFSFTLQRDDYPKVCPIVQVIAEELGARAVLVNDNVSKISLVGVGMRSHVEVASRMFSSLGREGIHIYLIIATEIKISALIDEKYLEVGIRTLHSAFNLDRANT
ncbi:aspartate kinase [Coxiella endosymbiont of Amblyomma americanum]|uniref:aspartate kinase n=2 Tax=Coxiellaceae TaxID=118968 RepID=UPI00057E21E4|nr:aspartate kinase [Coxiella endosymbiont of Amblyomma americanum]AJC50576.1 aspartate kinase [Coxiella endosymbiont of Amblyomma americanum]AUJ59056.1 aspartate kinase [Coxiella-like endosymbiont of Amblyomma americanum]